ncbi:MAG: hypothetical protein DMG24_21210 [Acidobacteria bacterium]|nr:MAG: hypothetical protein DMG24_21210 [Acidobacteriota bacterium]
MFSAACTRYQHQFAFRVANNVVKTPRIRLHLLALRRLTEGAADHARSFAAAYFSPWKFKIQQLSKGDEVFLYQWGAGIVGMGQASGKVEKAAYHADPKHKDEEYFMRLSRFQLVDPPVSPAEIKEITGTHYSFRSTMFSIDAESAAALKGHIQKRAK